MLLPVTKYIQLQNVFAFPRGLVNCAIKHNWSFFFDVVEYIKMINTVPFLDLVPSSSSWCNRADLILLC